MRQWEEEKKRDVGWGGWDDYIFVYIVLSLNEKNVHIMKGEYISNNVLYRVAFYMLNDLIRDVFIYILCFI